MQDRAAKPTPRRIIAQRLVLAAGTQASVHQPHASQTGACFFNGGVEPHLDDMLNDPIIAMVMQRDRVSADDVMSVMRAAARAV